MKTLIKELASFKHSPKDNVNDHTADALRYAFMSGMIKMSAKRPFYKTRIFWLLFFLSFIVTSIIRLYLLH